MSFVGKAFTAIGNALGGKPKATPAALPAPAASAATSAAAAPSMATPAVQAAADSARIRERAATGRAATMLTPQSDSASLTPTTARATLGGKLTDDQRMGARLLGR
jgi:hypothetical protein